MSCANLNLALFQFDAAMLRSELTQRGRARIVIVHRYGNPGTSSCVPGEEIAHAWILWCGRRLLLPLSGPHLILFDYVAKHSHIPQNARRIEEGLDANRQFYYAHHGLNSPGARLVRPRTTRTAVLKQFQRIRERLDEFFQKEQIDLDAWEILRSEATSSNEVRYWIDAVVRIEH